MTLTKLETGLFESVEFCLALLGTIPVPLCLVSEDDNIIPLNTEKLSGMHHELCCSHRKDPDSPIWKLDLANNCFLCKTVEECRETKQKVTRKGTWYANAGGDEQELVVVAHAAPINLRDEEYVLLAIEDITDLEHLKGLLPICMECNKIHDSNTDDWVRIDYYVTDHSSAKFSHGLCPDCAQRLLSDINNSN